MSNLSRFNVQESAIQAPGHCLICTGINGPFISTGVNVKFYGSVLICRQCLTEMNSIINPEPKVKPVQPILSKVQYADMVSDLHDGVNALVRRFAKYDLIDVPSAADEAVDKADGDAASESGETDESTSEQGAAGVPSTASSDALADLLD